MATYLVGNIPPISSDGVECATSCAWHEIFHCLGVFVRELYHPPPGSLGPLMDSWYIQCYNELSLT